MPRKGKSHGAGRRARRWFAQRLRQWADALDPPAAPVLAADSEGEAHRVAGPPAHWLAHIAQAGDDPVWLGSASLLPRLPRPVSPPGASRPRRAPVVRAGLRVPDAHAPRDSRDVGTRPPTHEWRDETGHAPAERSPRAADAMDAVGDVADVGEGERVGKVDDADGRRSTAPFEPAAEDTRSRLRSRRAPAPRRATVAPADTSEIWRQVDTIDHASPAAPARPPATLEPPATAERPAAAERPATAERRAAAEQQKRFRSNTHVSPPREMGRRFEPAHLEATAIVATPGLSADGAEPVEPWPELPPSPAPATRAAWWRQQPSSGQRASALAAGAPRPVSSDRWPELPPPPDLAGDVAWDGALVDPGTGESGRLDSLRGE